MRRVALVGIALGVLLLGCSKKDEVATPTTAAAGDAAAVGPSSNNFCEEIKKVSSKATSASGSGMPSKAELDGMLAQLQTAQAAAPASIKPAFTTMSDAFRQIAKLGEDPAAITKVMEVASDPKFQQAADDIQAYTKTACGFDLALMGGAPPTGPTDPTVPTTAPLGVATTIDKTSIDAVKAAVKARAGGAPWLAAIVDTGLWQYVAAGDSFDWDLQLAPDTTVSADDAVAACNAISEYLSPLQPGFTITIKDASGGPLVLRPKAAACAKA